MSLQSAERACCHSTGAGKLRQALTTCDDILIKQDQTLAELQNNMMLVKLDLRKKAACIAEQYHTVLKLQGQASTKKRLGTNQENQQPNQQPPGKKPFLRNLLPRTPTCQSSTDCSPYARILRSRRSPLLKSGPFGKNTKAVGKERVIALRQVSCLRNRSLLSFTNTWNCIQNAIYRY